MREHIINEIRRIADLNEGRVPGRKLFKAETGITERSWRGVYWSKWSDALKEAGFAANTLNQRANSDDIPPTL